ncbi:hypothetical protein [Mesorhizobium sp. KR9-304]|uniref:hypothetical protein n=1 Tax=Mesorhizobium sp. KR9-304 TaxID=3156614 RepID=UPI0032B33402
MTSELFRKSRKRVVSMRHVFAGAVSLTISTTAIAEPLTEAELVAFKEQVQKCWNIPTLQGIDPKSLRVSVQFQLDLAGNLKGNPTIISGDAQTSIGRAAAETARRAVVRCAPYKLPKEKYASWASVIVHFDPALP